jgi:4-hydroxybenzoate polyprenyltransferase
MPFAMIGFFLAINQTENSFDWKILIFIVLCMIFARNAAMGFNRFADRKIDKKNPRTTNREIPAGIIKEKSAILFVIINSLLFVSSTFFINELVFWLSPVALFIILAYSLTKKYTSICHFILGLGLSLAPIGAYLSVSEQFALLPVLFSFVVLFWVSGFDIIYALQDEEFDNLENLKSIPAFLGKPKALKVSFSIHIIVALLIVFVGFYGSFGLLFWIGSLIFIVLLFYQHFIVKADDLSRINLAFFTTNGIASVVFAIFVIFDFYLKI